MDSGLVCNSIRISDQWRVSFRWHATGPGDVEIVDYHSQPVGLEGNRLQNDPAGAYFPVFRRQ